MQLNEINKLNEALGLMNSMILSGELHTDQSHGVFRDAMRIIYDKRLELDSKKLNASSKYGKIDIKLLIENYLSELVKADKIDCISINIEQMTQELIGRING